LDEGIRIFGPESWLALAPFNTKIIEAYQPKFAYSLHHNELIYNRSKIGLNVCHTQNITGYPWRVPDILASDAILLSDPQPDLHEDFEKDIDLQVYESPAEAKDLAQKLLGDNVLRDDLISQQNEAIEQGFRWQHRMPVMQELTNVDLSKQGDEAGRYELFSLDKKISDNTLARSVFAVVQFKASLHNSDKPKMFTLNIKQKIKRSLWSILPEKIKFYVSRGLQFSNTIEEYK